MNLKIVLNQQFLFEPKKTPSLNQTTPKNTCQIFQPKKIRESKISTPEKTVDHPRYREIWSTALGFKNARKGMLSTGKRGHPYSRPFLQVISKQQTSSFWIGSESSV